jgi:polyferredoxin
VFRPRVLVYGAALLAIIVAFVGSLALRAPFRADVGARPRRARRMVQDGRIENVYKVQLMNATERTLRLRIGVDGLPGATLERRDSRARPDPGALGSVAVQTGARRRHAASGRRPPDAVPVRGDRTLRRADATVGRLPRRLELREKSTFVVPR